MSSAMRYWAMIAVLLAGIAGMGFLSHGESTPPARPLSDFPMDIGSYRTVKEFPFDEATLKVLGVTDYTNRVYFSPALGDLGLYIGYFRTQRTGAHDPLAEKLPAWRRLAANRFGNIPVVAAGWTQGSGKPVRHTQGPGPADRAVLVPVARPSSGQRILGQVLYGGRRDPAEPNRCSAGAHYGTGAKWRPGCGTQPGNCFRAASSSGC